MKLRREKILKLSPRVMKEKGSGWDSKEQSMGVGVG